MTEIEAKILEIDQEKVKAKLEKMGAQLSFEQEFFAIYFDDQDRKLANNQQVLRLRKEGDKAQMTFKAPSAVSKAGINAREELEVEIGDFDMTRTILEKLGYVEGLKMRKIRTQYDWGEVHIVIDRHIDDLDFIPPYLEIEAPNHDLLLDAAKKMGFKRAQLLDWNAAKVKSYYEGQANISL